MTPREPPLRGQSYLTAVRRLETMVEETIAKNVPLLLGGTPPRCMDIGLALYSAGSPPDASRRWFSEAVDHQLRFLQARGMRLGGFGDFETNLELLAAADLVGRGGELARAFRACKFTREPTPQELAILDRLYAILLEDLPLGRQAGDSVLRRVAPDWASILPLLDCVARRETAEFADRLAAFLSGYWRPRIRQHARDMARNKHYPYVGRWNLLAASLCRRMQQVPPLKRDLAAFVPIDLVPEPAA